jgi:hypothetical protein
VLQQDAKERDHSADDYSDEGQGCGHYLGTGIAAVEGKKTEPIHDGAAQANEYDKNAAQPKA